MCDSSVDTAVGSLQPDGRHTLHGRKQLDRALSAGSNLSEGRDSGIRQNRPGTREPDVNHTEFGNPVTESARGAVADAHGQVRK